MKLSSIAFASLESYHDAPISNIELSEAEGVLTDERKKYLRTAAKEKSGQAPGVGALSSAAKGVYSIMVKQAAVKQMWKEKHNEEADSDTSPLSDVEYDVAGAQAGSSQKGTQRQSAAKGTPPPPPPQKKRKGPEQQDDHEEDDTTDLTEILQSFELPETQLEFSFEELYKATSMRKTKVKLTGWMLIMSKLAEIQMESTLTAADELEEKQAHVEKLVQQVEKLKQKNKKLSDTIDQQQSVIQGIQGLLQKPGPTSAE